jgi:hypothetical protein
VRFERGEDSGKRNFSEKNPSLAKPVRLAPIPPPEIFILPNPRSAVFSGNCLWKRLVATWNGSNAQIKKAPQPFGCGAFIMNVD